MTHEMVKGFYYGRLDAQTHESVSLVKELSQY